MRPQIMMMFGISLDASREEVEVLKCAIDEAFDDRDAKEVKPEKIKPTAPATQPAPAPQEAPAAAPDNGGGLAPDNTRDGAGVPWDSRIHSDPPKLNKDGTWRGRRGVDAGLAARVTSELLATANATGVPAAPVVAPAPVAAPTPAPPAPAAPTPPAPPMFDPAYTAFVQYIASITISPDNPAGRVDSDWVKGVLTNYGVAGGEMQNLLHRLDLIPQIEAAIKGALG